ncbi:hypothetical protein QE152_g21978 [Popillia japonica]|uniref:Uncharacterized protein n=1 Tax=Popillia japonica TaxID=7064 RepID=A0AAW1KNG8_POPJA
MKKKEIMLSRSKSILNNFMTKYWQLKVQEMTMKRNIHKEYDEREYFAVGVITHVTTMDRAADTVKPTFFVCERWEHERKSAIGKAGELTKENLIEKMLENED